MRQDNMIFLENPEENTSLLVGVSVEQLHWTCFSWLRLSAEKGWRKLRGFWRLADDGINGVKFIDGVDENAVKRQGCSDWSCCPAHHIREGDDAFFKDIMLYTKIFVFSSNGRNSLSLGLKRPFSSKDQGGSCTTYLDIVLLMKYNSDWDAEPEKDPAWNGCAWEV